MAKKIEWSNETKKSVNKELTNVMKSLGMTTTRKISKLDDIDTVKGGARNGIGFFGITKKDADTLSRRSECYILPASVVIWCGKETPIYDVLNAMGYKYTQTGCQRRYTLSMDDVNELQMLTVKQGDNANQEELKKADKAEKELA